MTGAVTAGAGPARRPRRRLARRLTPTLVLVTAALAGCTADGAAERPDVPAVAQQVALSAPAPEPTAAPTLAAVPSPGTVEVLDGPFLDRLRLDLAVVDGTVSGTLDITSDVSELIALEFDVAWYDAAGVLLGAARHVVDPEEAEEHHTSQGVVGLPVVVGAPGAVSATVAVPVLVNE